MKRRVLVLPVAAAIIWGLCEYKLAQKYVRPRTDIVNNGIWRLAPSFEALDANEKVFRLQRYVGRQAMLLVFFDGKHSADQDSTIQKLVANTDQLSRKGYLVIAVSNTLPRFNRKVTLPKQFKLITDFDPLWAAHRIWNTFDEEHERPIPAVFAIDRAGNTYANKEGQPIPLENLDDWLRR